MTAGPTHSDSPEDLTLAGEFEAPTRERWRELVAEVLSRSGKDVTPADAEQALSTPTDDGFSVAPLYAAEDAPDVATGVPGLPPFVRGTRPEGAVPEGWQVRQRRADLRAMSRHRSLRPQASEKGHDGGRTPRELV